MAYDEELADRIRAAVGPRPDVDERHMFGGVAFLLDGKMFIGVADDRLMVRVGPEAHAKALSQPHALPMDFTGRPMKGYVFVAAAGVRTVAMVKKWTEQALAFVATVKTKPKKKARAKGKPAPRGKGR